MKKLFAVLTSVVMALSLVGCGASQSSVNTLNFASELDIISLDSTMANDSLSFTAIHAFTDGLMITNKEGEVVEAIASSYEESDDHLTYTFHLRDAKWSNGDSVTANDFVFAWRRAIQKSGNYAYMFGTDGANIKNADALMAKQQEGKDLTDEDMKTLGVEAKDDKTLVVTLETPCSYFLSLMTFPCFYPVNENFVKEKGDKYGTSVDTVLSNGAYVLKSWDLGSKATFVKNEQYYDADKVKLEELNLLLVQDPKTAALNFDSGANDYAPINSELVDKYKNTSNYHQFSDGFLYYLQLNFENKDLANLNIRKALSYAINRQDFTDNVLKDGSKPATGFVPSELSKGPDGKDFREASGTYTDYNVEQAQKYLDQGLKELGKDSIQLRLLYGTDESPKDTLAEYLQNTFSILKGLSIEMVATTKQDRIYNRQKNGDFDISVTAWAPDYADPTTYLNLLLENNSNNYGHYVSKEFNDLMNKAKKSVGDEQQRWNYLLQAEKVAMEDYAYIPVFEKGTAVLIADKVSGLYHQSVGVPETFHYVEIKSE